MARHNELIIRIRVTRQIHIHHRIQVHARFKIEEVHPLRQHGIALQVAALANLKLQLGRQPPRIYYAAVGHFCRVYDFTAVHAVYVNTARAMAALTVDAPGHHIEFVFTARLKCGGHRVVATHALQTNGPAETAVVAVLKSGRKIEHARLRVVREWRLKEIAILAKNMRIGVLPTPHNVMHQLCAAVVIAGFGDQQRIVAPKRTVTVAENRIVQHAVARQPRSTFLCRCRVETHAHTRMHKRLVPIVVALRAGRPCPHN